MNRRGMDRFAAQPPLPLRPRPRAPRTRTTGPNAQTLIVLMRRAERNGRLCCEGCGKLLPAGERGWEWSVQHRCPRGMGGTRDPRVNNLSRLMVLCGSATTPESCHHFAESRRTEARGRGWLVDHGVIDPAEVPVLIDNGARWVYLDDDGGYQGSPP